ncbi:hypothetical protein ABZ719_13395 [Streptomyces sp. NPDC006743]|uniref:hypothetical protein n=1 Tax=Streptomyces sp. NPDC006743 TaxID=3154480 RepID=UPI0034571173
MTRTTTGARIAAAGLLGALTLTACGSGGDPDSGSGASAATPSSSNSAGAASGGETVSGGSGTGGAGAEDSPLSGSWLTTSGGKAVVLIITGRQAALFSTDRTTCTGTAAAQAGKGTIRLNSCKQRSAGTVDSVNKTTLQVTWEGGLGKETYTRAEGGALPSGLPTASPGA